MKKNPKRILENGLKDPERILKEDPKPRSVAGSPFRDPSPSGSTPEESTKNPWTILEESL